MQRLVLAVVGRTLISATACSVYIGHHGEEVCVNSTTEVRTLLSKRERSRNSATVSMEDCFVDFCSSDFALNSVRTHAKNEGYKDADKISYHNTYFNEGSKYTYQWTGKMSYDMKHRQDSNKQRAVVYSSSQNNPTNSEAEMDFLQTVGEGVSMSWSSSQSYAFTDGVAATVKVEFPEIAEVSTTVSFSETWSLSEGTTKSTTATQSSSISNHLPIDPHTCARGCAVGSSAKVEVPYTVSGYFSASGSAYYGETSLRSSGAVCCYLRPGGSNECPTMGHNKGGSGGWLIAPSPGYAAYHGTCPNLKRVGDSAAFTQDGLWAAGLDLSIDVDEVVGPEGQCPSEDKCMTKFTDPAFVV